MKSLILAAALFSSFGISHSSFAAEPLRVFVRSGPKSHGPGAHDHPSFLKDWVPLLNERGAKATGGDDFPTKEQLAQTDVLIIHRDGGGDLKPEEQAALTEYTKRGGGIVVLHAGTVANTPEGTDFYKQLIGGSWRKPTTKWLEGPMNLYFTDRENPITKDMSNFAMDDEIYYDMDVDPAARVLAGAYTPKPSGARDEKASKKAEQFTKGGKEVSIYDIQPEVWMWEAAFMGNKITPLEKIPGVAGKPTSYRAFVCIPGHYYANFNRPNFRALILRGIAWAGKRENADELCKPDELGDNLRYVEGGPTRPEKAAEKLEVHPEFNISLVASEPLINKVMNVDWDEKGRLWVCETPEYPNGRRELNVEKWKDSGSWTKKYDRDPIDRISWLEDTNGDGVMDKKHVFADKLELVTSFCFYKNGVIACSAPDIWNLQDTDGDGVCDKREKIYTGLGTSDTHAVINNLRWGLDGWVYATHGYSSGHVTSPDGKQDFGTDGSGVVRFKPDGSAFEQYASRGGNTWGLDITWDGQVFFTQPTSGTVFFHVVLPEYVLAKGKIPGTTSWKGMIEHQKSYPLMSWPEQAYVQIDQVGQFTAAAGCAIYEGGAWPEKWNYSYFTTEPTINIVHHEFVKKDGVSYRVEKEKGREETEFIRSKDLWFRPIETRVGPDGALYVVDFYNQAVIHNDTRGPIHGPANAAVRPDRDHYFGRIWKVQHKEAKPVAGSFYHHGPDSKGTMGSAALKTYEAKGDSLSTFKSAQDDWTRSAVIAAASESPVDVILAASTDRESSKLRVLVEALLPVALSKGQGSPSRLIQAVAAKKTGDLGTVVIEFLSSHHDQLGERTRDIDEALKKILADAHTSLPAMKLASRWEGDDGLVGQLSVMQEQFVEELKNPSTADGRRLQICKALSDQPAIISFMTTLLESKTVTSDLKTSLVSILADGETQGLLSLVSTFQTLPDNLRSLAFDAVLKRPEATLALLTSIRDGKLDPKLLGPGNIARLRTHPNKNVAKQANAMMDKLNPNAKAKNELIAQFTPIVEQAGDAAKGKVLFTAACAICHKIDDIGKDVAPPLTGMGAHGPAALIIHVLDPNREVDPSFYAWNITKKNGETLAGVIASENSASVTLRNQAGDFEVKKDDIKERTNTRMSLMPEGLEGLGAENLRDILAFICGDAQKHFRVLDLRNAYTADSREGVFKGPKPNEGQVRLAKFGNLTVEGIPFFIQDAAKSATGSNLIVLKGGPKDAISQSFPAKVEVPINVETKRLQLLSGISGWGWPAVRDEIVALNATVVYASGEKENFALKNGIDFADYIRPVDVPGSQYVEGITDGQQMRLLTLKLTKKGVAKTLVLESPNDNHTVPVVVAVTADIEGKAEAKGGEKSAGVRFAASQPARNSNKGGAAAKNKEADKNVRAPVEGPAPADSPKEGGKGDGPLAPTTPVQWEAGKTKVLVIGGGSSHNFAKFFGDTDVATLKAAGYTVHYTEDRDQAADELAKADVAIISVNRKFFDTAKYRKALFDRVNSGKGVIMLHPGTWYGFPQWPEINAQIVGGGARGHDKLGPFTVNVTRRDHAIMIGVPASFDVQDELYYVNAEPDKIPERTNKIEVLAETSPSQKFGKPHPSVWITDHPKARIVGIALGHDERVHDMTAFKAILTNATKWVAGK